jgi:hypothetical protein
VAAPVQRGGQLVHLFSCQGIGDGIWKALIAVFYLGTGLYLRINPGLGIAALILTVGRRERT